MTKIRAKSSKSVFDFSSYKECLNWLLEEKTSVKGARTRLAEFVGSQPAYLSRVFNGEAHLSYEQAEAAARFFILNQAESNYFMALVGEERAGTSELRRFWQQQKQNAQRERLELKTRIQTQMHLSEEEKAIYFSQWYHAAIHAAISIPKLQTPEAIAKYFNLSLTTTHSALKFLTSVRLISKHGNRYMHGVSSLHLEKGSPLLGRHQLNWKIKSMEALGQPKEADVQYTSVISISKKDMESVREVLFGAIEGIRKIVKDSEEETVACYSFDFFELNRQEDQS